MALIGYVVRWSQLVLAIVLLIFEGIIRRFVLFGLEFLPKSWVASVKVAEDPSIEGNAEDIVLLRGYPFEEHFVDTEDGFILGIHRIPGPREKAVIPPRKSMPAADKNMNTTSARDQREHDDSPLRRRMSEPVPTGMSGAPGGHPVRSGTGKPVVFIMHGFLQSSEAWLSRNDPNHGLPYILAEHGYDVWLGNNRGNKYSYKHRSLKPTDKAFWDWSLDELIAHDVPSMINYVLTVTGASSLTYIGFSQGSAQAFGAFASFPELAAKINLFIAMAPATKVNRLHHPLVDAWMRTKPELAFSMFGEKALLPSTLLWRKIISRSAWVNLLDMAQNFLFGWTCANFDPSEKRLMYSHIYSYSSVKAVVHWLQIMQSRRFQMFDDASHSMIPSRYKSMVPPRYHVGRITCPIAVFYGDNDTLPDFEALLEELRPVFLHKQKNYEHLCFMWAKNAHESVFPKVIQLVDQYSAASAKKKKIPALEEELDE